MGQLQWRQQNRNERLRRILPPGIAELWLQISGAGLWGGSELSGVQFHTGLPGRSLV